MDEFPRFGQELADAQAQLDKVLARCAIRLQAFNGVAPANDNVLFPGKCAPIDELVPATVNAESHDMAG